MSLLDDETIPPVPDVAYNPFADGDPFATHTVAPSQPQIYEGVPDYSDGGRYDDDFGPPELPTINPAHLKTQNTPNVHQWANAEDFTTPDPQEPSQEPKNSMPWHIGYYSKYFDVDGKDVSKRIVRSIVPFSLNFFESLDGRPDLWGPFWISTTLIFIMAACSNFASWLSDRDHFHYEFEQVTFGAAAIYCYLLFVPLALFITLKCLAHDKTITYLQTICIYGYSLFIFIPSSILCIIPYNWLRWIWVFAAGLVSTVFLLMNFSPAIKVYCATGKQSFMIGLGTLVAVALLHLGLTLTFKLYFFNYTDA